MTIDLLEIYTENGHTYLFGGVDDGNDRWGLTYVLTSELNKSLVESLLANNRIITLPDGLITFVKSNRAG